MIYRKENFFASFCAESLSRSTSSYYYRPEKLPSTIDNNNYNSNNNNDKYSPTNVWINQLLQIPGVSIPIAKAISQQYPSLPSLLSIYTSEGMTEKNKALLLQDIGKENGRKVGPSISKKIYKLFTELDGTKLFQDL